MTGQLPLTIRLDDAFGFENFYPRATAELALARLGEFATNADGQVLLWGGSGVGKSHLLQALCQQSAGLAIYLPLKELLSYPADAVFDGCDASGLVVLDDLELMADRPDWQEGLFQLFNRLKAAGAGLGLSSRLAPNQLQGWLPDLVSRLASAEVFHLDRFSELELGEMLAFRAQRRGLTLSAEVVRYLLSRGPRGPAELMGVLEYLDREALARARPLTIPLINELKLFGAVR